MEKKNIPLATHFGKSPSFVVLVVLVPKNTWKYLKRMLS